MNLYLFNAHDSAAAYGIGTYLNELTRAMESTGINIHIIHLHSIYPEFEVVKINQVENWYIPEVRNYNTFSGSLQKMEDYYRNVIYILRLYIKDTKDLVFHFNYNQCYVLAKELKTVFNCKTVAVIHYMKWALELNGNLHQLRMIKEKSEKQRRAYEQRIYKMDEYEALIYKEVDRIIVLSQYTKNLLLSEYQIEPEKISVIPNGLADRCLE